MAGSEKELKKLKRVELLELLLEQSKENEALKKKIDSLNEYTAQLNRSLEDKSIKIEKAGTLAEASLALNGVFDSAHAAAQQYLDNLQALYDREKVRCTQREAATEAYVKRLLEETQQQCEIFKKATVDKCSAMTFAAKEQCEKLKEETRQFCLKLEAETKRKCEESEQRTKVRCEEREKELQVRLREIYEEERFGKTDN